MDGPELLRFDYEQTTQLMRTLTDIRFKLLAFIPTIAGASVGLASRGARAGELLAVGLLGLVATLGILIYELGNSQVYRELVERATELEQQLGLGLFSRRRHGTTTLFGVVAARHDRMIAILALATAVYGAALAGWTYLVVWGLLRALDVGGARQVGAVIGVLVGAAVVVEIERLGQTPRS